MSLKCGSDFSFEENEWMTEFPTESFIELFAAIWRQRTSKRMQFEILDSSFFAQSANIKLNLSQAARLSIYFFIGKSVVLQLHEGPELRMDYWWDREEEKTQHPAGFKLTTSLSWGVRSTAVLQPLPKLKYFVAIDHNLP